MNFLSGLMIVILVIWLIFVLINPQMAIPFLNKPNRKKGFLIFFVLIIIFGNIYDPYKNDYVKDTLSDVQVPINKEQTVTKVASDTLKKETNIQKPVEKEKPRLELIEHHVEKDDIVGTIKNNTDSRIGYAQVIINLYDKNGVQVGSTMDNINNIDPHGTWKFKAIVLEDNVDKYKIVEITEL